MHANSSKAGILGRIAAAIAGVPVRIFTVHGWAYHAHTGTAAKIYLWAERLVAPLTTLTICVADRDRTSGIAARACRADSTVVQHNAVPLPPAAEGARRTPRLSSAVGRLKAPKDFSTLLQALAQLEPGASARGSSATGRNANNSRTEARTSGSQAPSSSSASATTLPH